MSRTSFVSTGIGVLTRDPVIKNVGKTKVTEISMVFNEVYGKNDYGQPKVNSSFFSFELWDSAAEYVANYAKTGDRLYFEATPRQDKWVKDGQNREKTIFRINKFVIINKRQEEKNEN